MFDCPHCSNQLPDGAAFCNQCWRPVDDPPRRGRAVADRTPAALGTAGAAPAPEPDDRPTFTPAPGGPPPPEGDDVTSAYPPVPPPQPQTPWASGEPTSRRRRARLGHAAAGRAPALAGREPQPPPARRGTILRVRRPGPARLRPAAGLRLRYGPPPGYPPGPVRLPAARLRLRRARRTGHERHGDRRARRRRSPGRWCPAACWPRSGSSSATSRSARSSAPVRTAGAWRSPVW